MKTLDISEGSPFDVVQTNERMKLGLAYFEGFDREKVNVQKQLGLDYVISGAGGDRKAPPHTYESVAAIKKMYADEGLRLSIIEGPPALDEVKLGRAGADQQMANFKEFIKACGDLGVNTVCYNWMPVLGWYRTKTDIITRGGATVTGFDFRDTDPEERTYAGDISEEKLWSTLEGFLREIIPVCESYGVRLALHPDDPPVSPLKGIGRILTSADAFERVFSLYDSPMNGMTFCQGCFATMGEDIPGTIRRFGRDKIYFVHFRDVQGDRSNFHETFHDDGKTDMYEAMKAYYEIGFDGIARPDHVPTLIGEDDSMPSYGVLGNYFAVGYIRGLMEAAQKELGAKSSYK